MRNNMLIKKSILIIFILSIASTSLGAPVITGTSGTYSHGNSVTITGSGFTTKATAAPLRWEDFEGYVDGNKVSSESGWWSDRSATEYHYVSSDNPRHSNSAQGMRVHNIQDQIDDGNDVSPHLHRQNVGFDDTGKILVYVWMYLDWGTTTSDTSYQFKSIRISANEGTGDFAMPGFSYFPWRQSTTWIKYYWSNNRTPATISKYFTTNVWGDANAAAKWHQVTLVADMGTAGNSDCSWYAYATQYDQASAYDTIDAQENVMCIGVGQDQMDAVVFQDWIGSVASGSVVETTYYWDDLYIDNVWNRVEIGDQSSYSNCTKREIQIPTAWSTTSITIDFNQGAFADAATAYVFVVDSSNNVSSSWEITIGGVGGGSPGDETAIIGGSGTISIGGAGSVTVGP
jgi:hypothetical protein